MHTDNELEYERLLLDITEMICELMEKDNVSRAELARRLGTSKGYITQILAGSRNLTLRTLSDLAGAIGYRLLPEAMPLAKPYSAYLAGRVPGCLWSERGDLAMDYEGVVDAFDSLDGSLRLAACNDAKTESDVTADQVPDSVALAA